MCQYLLLWMERVTRQDETYGITSSIRRQYHRAIYTWWNLARGIC